MAFQITAYKYDMYGKPYALRKPMIVEGDEDDVDRVLKRMETWPGFFLARVDPLPLRPHTRAAVASYIPKEARDD